jgi:ABC-type lipoprotein export system ATPase subunit
MTDPDPAVVVESENITKVYPMPGGPIHALRGITLTVGRGTFLSIAGPSGCGKSTLLYLLGGVDRPTSGSVLLLGARTDELSDAALARIRLRHVGLVFQRFFLLPTLSAEENVAVPMMEAGIPPAERRRVARAVLERVGLADRAHHRPGQLSGGEMQRVAIARAIAMRPALLLADEPTGELDETTGREIGRLLQELSRDGLAVVLVTHNPELAALADRQVRMRDGMIV